MEGLAELSKNSELYLVRFSKYVRQNHKGELAELDQALNSAPRRFATLSKHSFLMGGLAELRKNSELCPTRFAKYAKQNHNGELVELD